MNIFIGFLPWIVFWVLSSNDTFLLSLILSFAVSLLFNISSIIRKKAKILDIGSMIFFGTMIIVSFFVGEEYLAKWINVLGNVSLSLIILFSIIIKNPFTIQYAKESVEEKYWNNPLFKSINYTITWVWFFAFVIKTFSSVITVFYPRYETIFSWAIPITIFVIVIKFSSWYPDYKVRKGTN